jgi:hypothetical protein
MAELGVVLATGSVVVALVYLGLSTTVQCVRQRPLSWVARSLNKHWGKLLVASVLMLVSFLLWADNYGAAQKAADAATFAELVPTAHRNAYIATAWFDVLFAAVYGAFALSVLPTLRRWGGCSWLIGSIGAGVLLLAACLDEVENTLMLVLLGRLPLEATGTGVDEDLVGAMTAVGSVKLPCFYVGWFLLVSVGVARWVGNRLRRRGSFVAPS